MLTGKLFLWLLLSALLALPQCFRPESATESSDLPALTTKYRGVNWVAGDSATAAQLAALKTVHVQWIAQTPFGWQRSYNQPDIRISTHANKHYWGESDQGLIHTTKLAKQAGVKTLLKPHLWLTDRSGKWLGDIEMTSEADWQAWFRNYTAFILHYARLAEENNIEALCIGTELMKAAVTREQEWREVIREIRKIYRGQLTYAANWYLEYEQIKFWDDLDFIGVQGYFPLTKQVNPSVATLTAGWKPHVAALEKMARKYRKSIVFTEVGYKSTPDAAIEPWLWPERGENVVINTSDSTQANCYDALFRALWHQPWFGGTFIWKWYPQVRPDGRAQHDFTPQHKPAEKVLTAWYGK